MKPKNNSKRICYGLLPSTMADPSITRVTPIIITEGETGYHETDWTWDKKVAEKARDAKNAALGISPEEADRMMAASMFQKPKCKCDDCGWEGPQEELECQLEDIPGLLQRIEPGGIVPAGECPDCGCLAYPVKASRAGAKQELLKALKAVLFDLETTHKWQMENGRIDPVLVPQRETDIARAKAAIANAERK